MKRRKVYFANRNRRGWWKHIVEGNWRKYFMLKFRPARVKLGNREDEKI